MRITTIQKGQLMRYGDTESYSLIESKDIREHLESIGFTFTPRDTAYLIWMCDRLSVEERCGAWREVMEGCDDSDLKELLSQAVAEEERLTRELTAPGRAVFSCIYYDYDGGTAETLRKDGGSFAECAQMTCIRNIRHAEICRELSDGSSVCGKVRPDGIVMRIGSNGPNIRRGLHSLGFEFPSPFKFGETLRYVNAEGIFGTAALTYLGCYYDPDFGMCADCEFTNALGQSDSGGIPLIKLEQF